MQRNIIITEDGSSSIFVPQLNESYHSKHGAVAESLCVFIQNGFYASDANPLRIFEVGFGTGLNALLTCIEAEKTKRKVIYHSIEKFPLSQYEYNILNYNEINTNSNNNLFALIHEAKWEQETEISEYFTLKKIEQSFVNYQFDFVYDLFYFDAFSPETQPELWTEQIFRNISKNISKNGILTTYCCKGIVKRALKTAGFKIEKLPGPKGKREILRAFFL